MLLLRHGDQDPPQPDPPPLEGEWIKNQSVGDGGLGDAHTDEIAATQLRGSADDIDIASITQEWVLKRLVKEATDFGARTRQSSRVGALKLIGETFAMFAKVVQNEPPVDAALRGMPPWQRRQRILELAMRMAEDPNFASSVAKAAIKDAE